MTLTMSEVDLRNAPDAPPPCPSALNLAAHALAAARSDPDKIALTIVGAAAETTEALTFRELERRVLSAAGGLAARGVARGDRVMLRIGHSTDFPILFLAAAALGAVAVPTSTMLSAREAALIAEETGARLIAAPDDLRFDGAPAPFADPADIAADPIGYAPTAADDLAYVIYTSGSSGRPKGVAHAHRAVWARRMMWRGWYGLGPEDVMLHAGAFNWTYTLGAGLMDPWAAGASTVIYAGPRDPGIWPAIIRAHGATIFAAAPGVYRQLLKSGAPLGETPTLRHALSAGETMAADTRKAWIEATGAPVYEALGMTEISTYVSSSPDARPRPGFAGRPQPGRRVALLPIEGGDQPVAIGEDGVLSVHRSDPGLMLGYWRREAETEAAFRGDWFVTGDVCRMDRDGYIAFRGRADDQMNALGYRVAPEEVEAALIEHPSVSAAAAVELPVRADLSVIAAFLTIEGEAPSEDELRAHAAERLAAYKVPKIFRIAPDLPRNPNGKLRRRDLIEEHGYKSCE